MGFVSVFSFQVDLTDCACAAVAVVVRVRGQSISQSDVIEMMPNEFTTLSAGERDCTSRVPIAHCAAILLSWLSLESTVAWELDFKEAHVPSFTRLVRVRRFPNQSAVGTRSPPCASPLAIATQQKTVQNEASSIYAPTSYMRFISCVEFDTLNQEEVHTYASCFSR